MTRDPELEALMVRIREMSPSPSQKSAWKAALRKAQSELDTGAATPVSVRAPFMKRKSSLGYVVAGLAAGFLLGSFTSVVLPLLRQASPGILVTSSEKRENLQESFITNATIVRVSSKSY